MDAVPTVIGMTASVVDTAAPAARPVRRIPGWVAPWPLALTLLAVATALLTVWAVNSASESEYYAAIAVSMSQNPANFFFGAFDPAGTVTLDKIPGSYWIPALFVALFGYSTWTVVLPNALAAVATVVLVAVTAKRLVSPTAGLIAGAVAATTPIFIAVSRSNQPETFFVLCLALTGWAAARALTTPSLGRLIVTGVFIALAFQTYMLEAWALWPALALGYLATRQPWVRKLWHLAVAGVISLVASVTWIVIVALIPADQRPYIGSTLTNNPWEMVFGYNGLGRFSATADSSDYLSFTPPFSGDASVVRLFNEQLAGQIAWLLPAAALGVVVLWMLRFSRATTVFLAAWLVVFAAMFSAVAGMHQFYTAALAVPVALLVGLTFGVARRRNVLWPQIALIAVAGVSAVAVSAWYPGYSTVVSIVQAVLAAGAIVLLLAEKHRRELPRWVATVTAALALTLTPAVWSAVTIAHPSNINPVAGGVSEMGGSMAGGAPGGGMPGAGMSGGAMPGNGNGRPAGPGGMGQPPAGSDGGTQTGAGRPGANGTGAAGGTQPGFGTRTDGGGVGDMGSAPGGASASPELISWLQARQGTADYLVATFGSQSAAGIILATDGGSVLPIGGFNLNDSVPTLERFQALVADGSLRYVLASETRGGGEAGSSSTASQIRTWVEANCTTVSDAPGSSVIYDCAS